MIQSIVLGVVQGLTEFIPVSSSGHLIILPKLLGWEDQGLAYDAIIHLGTLLAVLIYFHNDIKSILKNIISGKTHLAFKIMLATIPAFIVGFFFKDYIGTVGRTTEVVAISLIFWGLIMIIADRYSKRDHEKHDLHSFSIGRALFIGIAQAIALIPGTSRSGVTIISGLFSDISREDAIRFSFLLSIPVILGAGTLNLIEWISTSNGEPVLPLLLALLSSFLSGLLAIHFMMKFVAKRGLSTFGIYRVLLGGLLLFLF